MFYKTKKNSEKSGIISQFLQVRLISVLMEDSPMPTSDSPLNQWWYNMSSNRWETPLDACKRILHPSILMEKFDIEDPQKGLQIPRSPWTTSWGL